RSSKDFSCSKSLTSTESAERTAHDARGHGRSVNELTAVADQPGRGPKTAGSEPVFTKLMTPEV
ncbi:MAG: hypothetical protein ABSE87_13030, partial [Terracidiphilus sp.]